MSVDPFVIADVALTTIGVFGLGWLARDIWDALRGSWRRARDVVAQAERETAEDQVVSAVRREPPVRDARPASPGHAPAPGPLRPLPCGHPTETVHAVRWYACGAATIHNQAGRVIHTVVCTAGDIDREIRNLLS